MSALWPSGDTASRCSQHTQMLEQYMQRLSKSVHCSNVTSNGGALTLRGCVLGFACTVSPRLEGVAPCRCSGKGITKSLLQPHSLRYQQLRAGLIRATWLMCCRDVLLMSKYTAC